MKVIDVGQEALKAQGEVMQRVAMRVGRRVAYFIIAAIFGLFALVSFHAVLWAFASASCIFRPLLRPARCLASICSS